MTDSIWGIMLHPTMLFTLIENKQKNTAVTLEIRTVAALQCSETLNFPDIRSDGKNDFALIYDFPGFVCVIIHINHSSKH